MYDTAYQRSAKFKPNNSIENISGLMFGKAIILILNTLFNYVVKTKTHKMQELLSRACYQR